MTDRRRAGSAYVVAPDSGSGPGVLLLHPWWGLTPFFRQMADRLADAGFVALAPDLFEGQTAATPEEGQRLLEEADPNTTAQLVLSSISALRSLPITPDAPIGVVGLSMGASWALWGAARVPELVGAVSVFYGTTDVDFAPVRAAVQGHFAEFDEMTSDDDVVEMEAHLRLVGCEVDIHRYPGAAHWFMEADREVAHSPVAAELAWERTVEFLRDRLGPAAP